MDELAPGIWLDQYGTWFMPDGRQLNHVPASTGNLIVDACPWCKQQTDECSCEH
jgi:hypothetical protein